MWSNFGANVVLTVTVPLPATVVLVACMCWWLNPLRILGLTVATLFKSIVTSPVIKLLLVLSIKSAN